MEGVLDLRVGHSLGEAPEDVPVFRFEPLEARGSFTARRTAEGAAKDAAMRPVQGGEALLKRKRPDEPFSGAGGGCAVKEGRRAAGSNDDGGEAGLPVHQLPGALNAAKVRKFQFDQNQSGAHADEFSQSLMRRPEEAATPELAGEAEDAGEQAARGRVALHDRQADWLYDGVRRRTRRDVRLKRRRSGRDCFGMVPGCGDRAMLPVTDWARVAGW